MVEFDVDNSVSINSSMIKSVGTRDHFLIVEFKNGDIYRYPHMAHEYSNLTSADSVGKYFHANIRAELNEKLSQGEWPED